MRFQWSEIVHDRLISNNKNANNPSERAPGAETLAEEL